MKSEIKFPILLSTLLLAIQILLFSCSANKYDSVDIISPKEAIELNIKARGGRVKLLEVKSMKMVIVDSINNTYSEVISQYPDKIYMNVKSSNNELVKVLNGEKAIVKFAGEAFPVTNETELRNLKEDAKIFPELYPKLVGYRYENARTDSANEEVFYIMDIILPDNSKRTTFLNSETWLLKKIYNHENKTETIIHDYQEIEGIKMLHTFTIIDPERGNDFEVVEIEFNPELEGGIFNLE